MYFVNTNTFRVMNIVLIFIYKVKQVQVIKR